MLRYTEVRAALFYRPGKAPGVFHHPQPLLQEPLMLRFSPRRVVFPLLLAAALPACAWQPPSIIPPLSPSQRAGIDELAQQVLRSSGAAGASLAVVKDGQIAYVHAYGFGRLEPLTPARPSMLFDIGSVSKQFIAAAILLLAERGKLSLDDPVSRFLPDLTRANQVTIRELLSHTSGYRDYWPQDYLPPFMLAPVTPGQILDRWARMPLDFDPGTQWQYSNTGYVAAGLIVEKAAGMSLMNFLKENIFDPLGMKQVADADAGALRLSDATGYLRYAAGPEYPAPQEGVGWLFAAAELAMTAEDLGIWDLAMIQHRLLSASSYREMQREVLLSDGEGAQYGLGIGIRSLSGHRLLEHSGEVSGYCAENYVFPDDGAAIAVLTNQDATNAAEDIARQIAALLFTEQNSADAQAMAQASAIFQSLQLGQIDRSLFTADANYYFTAQALKDFAASFPPPGLASHFIQTLVRERGGMTLRLYSLSFAGRSWQLSVRTMPNGKIEQYMLTPN